MIVTYCNAPFRKGTYCFAAVWGQLVSPLTVSVFFTDVVHTEMKFGIKIYLRISRLRSVFNYWEWSSSFWQSCAPWTPLICSLHSFSLERLLILICRELFNLDTSYLIGWCILDSNSRLPLLNVSSKGQFSFPCTSILPMYSAYIKGLCTP